MHDHVKQTIYAYLLFVCIISSMVSYAEENLEKKLEDVNQSIQATESEKKRLEAMADEIKYVMIELDEKIEEKEFEIQETMEQVEIKHQSIDQTQEVIDQTNQQIENKQDQLGKRVRVMYRTSELDYIRILLSSSNLTEVLSNLTMIKQIVAQDNELITALKEDFDQLNHKRIQLEEEKMTLTSLQTTLEAQQKQLVFAKSEQSEKKAKIEADAAKQELLHVALAQEAEEINKQIKKLQEQERFKEQMAVLANQQEAGPAVSGGQLNWPVPGHHYISSYYTHRISPITGRAEYHTGIDIPAPSGTNIVSAESGVVIFAARRGTYGNAIMVDHGGGRVTLYGHCSSFIASVGQVVDRGEAIARIGSTGYSTGPHLHFEVRINGQHTNPLPYVNQ